MKIPVGIGNVSMTKVRAQCGHMPFDRLWITATLFKRTSGKGVTKVMKMRTGMARSKPQSDMPDQLKEYLNHRGVAQGCPFDGVTSRVDSGELTRPI